MASFTIRGQGTWIAVAGIAICFAFLFVSVSLLTNVAGQTHPCENGVTVLNPSANPGLVADCKHLLGMKDQLEGTYDLRWRSSASISSWFGVTTGGTPTRVQRIEINNAQVNGRLPKRLQNLDGLRTFNLQNSSFTGTIPKELGKLPNLRRLDL